MRYRTLRGTELTTSELGLGTVELGMQYGLDRESSSPPDEAGAIRLLHRSLDLGIRFFDTARSYGNAEAILGRALKSQRQRIVLASKVSSFAGDAGRMRPSVQESLRLLDTEYLDLLQLHCGPRELKVDQGAIETMAQLKAQGYTRYLGASVYGEAAALNAIDSGVFDCIQIAFSVLDRRPEARVLPTARAKTVGVIARSVLLKGALSQRFRTLPEWFEPLKTAIAGLAQMGKGDVAGLPELAYRYALGRAGVDIALVGTADIAELEAAVAFAERGALPGELIRAIEASPLLDEKMLDSSG